MSFIKRIAQAVWGAAEETVAEVAQLQASAQSSSNGNGTAPAKAPVLPLERQPKGKSSQDLQLEADTAEYRRLMARMKKTNMDFASAIEEKKAVQREFDTQAIKSPRFDLMSEDEIRAAIATDTSEEEDDGE